MKSSVVTALVATLTTSACLDWDALRGSSAGGGQSGDASTGGTGGADAGTEPAPIVRWAFVGNGPISRIDDSARALPNVPLVPGPENAGQARVADGWLQLNGSEFIATASGSQALATALNASAGITVELWIDPPAIAGVDSFVSVLGLSFREADGAFVSDFASDGVTTDLGPGRAAGSPPVHLAVTIEKMDAGSSARATLVVSGAPAAIENLNLDEGPLRFTATAGIFLGSEDWNGRIGTLTIYDQVLGFDLLKAHAAPGNAPR